MNVKETAAKIIDHLAGIVEKYQLELLQRHPKDLLVHDRDLLEACAYPGMQIAWMVGHCHTHMFPLGLHPEQNIGVTWVTNWGNDDRFFVIEVLTAGDFSVKELDRKQFEALQHTPLQYVAEDPWCTTNFWLLKHGQQIGHVATDWEVAEAGRRVVVKLTPVAGCSELDRFALKLWGAKEASTKAHSLFTPRRYEWNPAVERDIRQAA